MSDKRSILEKFCKNNNCGDCIYMRYLWDSLATHLWQESAEQFTQSKGVNLFPQSNLKKIYNKYPSWYTIGLYCGETELCA